MDCRPLSSSSSISSSSLSISSLPEMVGPLVTADIVSVVDSTGTGVGTGTGTGTETEIEIETETEVQNQNRNECHVAKRPRHQYQYKQNEIPNEQVEMLASLPPLAPIIPSQPLPLPQQHVPLANLFPAPHPLPPSSSFPSLHQQQPIPTPPAPSTPTDAELTPTTSPAKLYNKQSIEPRTPARMILQTLIANPCRLNPKLSTLLNSPPTSDHVTSLLRTTAVNYLATASFHLNLRPHTYAVTIRLLDELLCLQVVTKQRFQALSTSCLFIACKLEESKPPSSKELSKLLLHDESLNDIIITDEKFILHHLQYDIAKQSSVGVVSYLASNSINRNNNEIEKLGIGKDAEYITLIGYLSDDVCGMNCAAVAIAATRIALCVNGYSIHEGFINWIVQDFHSLLNNGDIQRAVIALINTWLIARKNAGHDGRAVVKFLADTSKAFERRERQLRTLVDCIDEEMDFIRNSLVDGHHHYIDYLEDSNEPSHPGSGGDGLLRSEEKGTLVRIGKRRRRV